MVYLQAVIVLQGILCLTAEPVNNRSDYVFLTSEQRLLNDLMDGYEPSIRPVQNISEPIQVSIGMIIINILDLNEKDEYLEVNAHMMKHWHDLRLQWDKTRYNGIDALRIPANKIWVPDIIPYNSIDSEYNILHTMAVLYASGHVNWIPPARLRTQCRVDLTKFPFDEQTCSIKLGSWTYNGHNINITLWGGAKSALQFDNAVLSSEWTLVSSSARINTQFYACCPEPYQDLMFSLTLRRNPVFYAHVFVIPALLLGMLVPFQLLLPPESKERLTLGAVLIVSVMLLTFKLQDVLPDSVSAVPALEIYYMLTLIWIVMSILSSIWVLNVHNRGPRRGKVPDIIRWIFLRSLKRLVCLGSDSYYPLDEMETISMRGLDKSVGISSPGDGQIRNQDSRPPTKLERDVEDLLKQVHLLTTRAAISEARQEMLSEWHQVALVMDRVLFFFFMVIFLMCSVILLT